MKSEPKLGRAASAAGVGVSPKETSDTRDGALRLLQLEAEARRSRTVKELTHHLANESRTSMRFRQCFVFRRKGGRVRVTAVSSLSALDRNAPMIRWIEAVVKDLLRTHGLEEPRFFQAGDFGGKAATDADEYPFRHLIWLPLKDRKNRIFGGALMAREKPWLDRDAVLAGRLGETYSHAFVALGGGSTSRTPTSVRRLVGVAVLAAVVAAGFIPAPITTIAPVRVVGADAAVIAAPLDGVIAEVAVTPDTPVTEGSPLFRLEDTELRNAVRIEAQALSVAEARVEQLRSSAFVDAAARNELAIADAERDLAAARLALAEERLSRVEQRAPAAGVAIFADVEELTGRPVALGEAVMEIADPTRVEYEIALPVDDLIVMETDAKVRVFLDSEPLSPRSGVIVTSSYHARPGEDGALVYRIRAELTGDGAPPRIGARGAAQIFGPEAPLYFVALRRPISWLRQRFGL